MTRAKVEGFMDGVLLCLIVSEVPSTHIPLQPLLGLRSKFKPRLKEDEAGDIGRGRHRMVHFISECRTAPIPLCRSAGSLLMTHYSHIIQVHIPCTPL